MANHQTQARIREGAEKVAYLGAVFFFVESHGISTIVSGAGSGCSVAWLARLTGGQEVESSNLSIPTTSFPNKPPVFLAFTHETSAPCTPAVHFADFK